MRQYVRCCNNRCKFVGYLEGREMRAAAPSKVAKARQERRGEKVATVSHIEFRCPMCATRWRVRQVGTSSH